MTRHIGLAGTRAFTRITLFCAIDALCACGDSSPSPDGGGPGRGADGGAAPAVAGTCGDFGRNAACAGCIADMCCAFGAACYASDDCFGLDECARHCAADAPDCAQACGDRFPSGRGAYNALVLCIGDHWLDACPFAAP